MKKLLSLVLILSLCLSFASCDNSSDIDYKIVSENGQSYIVFDPMPYYRPQLETIGDFEFASLNEFKDTVVGGKPDKFQSELIMSHFAKSEDGYPLVCDFDNLYQPIVPDDCSFDHIWWSGVGYSFIYKVEEDTSISIDFYPEDVYQTIYKRDFESFFDHEGHFIEINEHKTADGKTETYYTTTSVNFKRVSYVLSQGDKSFTVVKECKAEASCTGGKDILHNMEIFCLDGDVHFIIKIYVSEKEFADEYLLQFGLTPYEE